MTVRVYVPREIVPWHRRTGSAFRQQRLSAWQPILTAGTVLPTFFLMGLAFIPIGILLLLTSGGVEEIQVDYTDCNTTSGALCKDLLEAHLFNKSGPFSCLCQKEFEIERDILRHVYVYYGLSNFYQNHRRYVKSRSDKQLLGRPMEVSPDCAPFDKSSGENGLPIAPCGAIANSLFNDTISLWKREPDDWRPVDILKDEISWPSDRYVKFRNASSYEGTAKPPYWEKSIAEMGGFTNEALIVWMRTAALPTFRKLYGRIDHDRQPFTEMLPKGRYRVDILYNYPVARFKGTKRVIISNTSWLGGKNPFLGIAYLTVGGLCLVLGAGFLFIHHKFGKNVGQSILEKHGVQASVESISLRSRAGADSQTIELVGTQRSTL